MSADASRKTLLERVVESLPEPLRQAYEATSRKNSKAHEILRLFVAKYLWDNGFRSISFEKSVQNGHENMCIDIYEDTMVLFVECERYPERRAVIERLGRLRETYPTAKFVIATQDRMGWRALRLSRFVDEVWVVCRDGRVQSPKEWADERKRLLQSILNTEELEGLMKAYKQALREYKRFRELSLKEETYWRQLLTQTCLKARHFKPEWLKDISIKGAWSKHAEAAWRQMQEAKAKIIRKIVELLNTIASLSSPYTIRLDDDGIVTVSVDWDAWEWLGWKDHPGKDPSAQYQILEENLQKELKIATKNMKPKQLKTRTTIEQEIEAKLLNELQLNELQKEINELMDVIKKYLEKNRNQQTTNTQPNHHTKQPSISTITY